ncbi:MAG TPA: alcohol dehydrogenase catalytic domain-containing protein [Acidimicrobiales bacterium]|nr:alcohol dehydrogenase catalytic domain-containing protein [Acidimicrobiales bacterium]
MPAAVYRGPRSMAVEDRPLPELGANDVLVAVAHCGVCGSDLHTVMEGWARPGSIGGHEWAGRVAAVGPAVSRWSVGDEVVGGAAHCGSCRFCLAGRPSLCTQRALAGTAEWQGAFAAYVRESEDVLHRVPPGLPLRAAALAEPLAVALHGISRSGARAGLRVLVTGAGPIGALVTAALVATGITDLTVSEPFERRRELASRLGAATTTPDTLTRPEHPGALVDAPYDVVVECSGSREAMEAGLAQLDRAGTLVLVGAGIRAPRFDPVRILLNELVVTGAYEYDATGWEDALALLSSGRLPVDDLVEPGDVPLEGLLPALNGLAAGDIAGKVLVAPT